MTFIKKAFRSFIVKTDLYLLFLSAVCSGVGLTFVYSATHSFSSNRNVVVQTAAIVLGLVFMLILSHVDYELVCDIYIYISILSILFLLSVFVFGEKTADSSGNLNWIRFGPVGVQPSEFVKVSFIVVLAKLLTKFSADINSFKNVAIMVLSLIIPLGIIILQDDLGQALVFIFIFFGMCFASGVNLLYFVAAAVCMAGIFPVLWTEFLKDYQKMRILTAFNPELDPLKYGYQVIQSKTAIGSGRIWGSGLLQGSITQNELLPEKHTDFIFAVIGEEGGLVCCTIVVLLLTALIIRCLIVAFESQDRTGKLICVGVASMLIFQTAENIGMCVGLLPVVGITLPLFSYGGSSVLTIFLSLGLVMSVRNRPKDLLFS